MKTSTAVLIVGGVAVGTTTAAAASIVLWSVIPISIWTMSATVIGSQTMNVLRAKTGQLQPVRVIASNDEKVVPLKQQA